MSFKNYLGDRLGLILTYYLGIFFAIVVSSLSSMLKGYDLDLPNVFYAFCLASFFLLIFFLVDYQRRKKFLSVLVNNRDRLADIHYINSLPKGLSKEYDLLRSAFLLNYSHYVALLDEEKRANKVQNEFNNRWIHEMKTPLSVLSLLVEKEGASSKNHMTYGQMAEELEKLSNGLDMALYTLRLKDFKDDFKVEEVPVLPLIREVINKNKSSFIVNQVYPRLLVEEDITLKTDKKWLAFVLGQILNNSIKYTKVKELGPKEVVFNVLTGETRTILTIEDTGVGIEASELSRIFNPFFTGSNGRKYSESTGMGLYLVKEVLNKLGHKIEVQSKPGLGTKISISFHREKNIYRL